jgi:multidrug efflux pump subunit AcrA (membrane-fusion protein)
VNKLRTWLLVVAVVLAALGLYLTRRGPVVAPPGSPVTVPPVIGQPRVAGELVLHGRVEAAQRRSLPSPVAGRVAALLTTEGAPVLEGQDLLQLVNSQVDQRLKAARTAAAATRNQPVKPAASFDPKVLAERETMLTGALGAAETADQDLARYRRLHGDAASALKSRRAAEADAARTLTAYTSARRRFEKLQRRYAPPAPLSDAARRELAAARELQEQARELNGLAETRVAQCRKVADQYPNEIIRLETMERVARDASSRRDLLSRQVRELRVKRDQAGLAVRSRNVSRAQQALDQAEAAKAKCQIKAPVSGRLVKVLVRPGETVTAGQTLGEIALQGGARLVATAAKTDLPRLQVGQDVSLEPANGAAFAGRISQLDPAAQPPRVYLQPLGNIALPAPGTSLVVRLRPAR